MIKKLFTLLLVAATGMNAWGEKISFGTGSSWYEVSGSTVTIYFGNQSDNSYVLPALTEKPETLKIQSDAIVTSLSSEALENSFNNSKTDDGYYVKVLDLSSLSKTLIPSLEDYHLGNVTKNLQKVLLPINYFTSNWPYNSKQENVGSLYTIENGVLTFTTLEAGDFAAWISALNYNSIYNSLGNYTIVLKGNLNSSDLTCLCFNNQLVKKLDLSGATVSSDDLNTLVGHYDYLVLPNDATIPTDTKCSSWCNDLGVVIIPTSDKSNLTIYSTKEGAITNVSSLDYIQKAIAGDYSNVVVNGNASTSEKYLVNAINELGYNCNNSIQNGIYTITYDFKDKDYKSLIQFIIDKKSQINAHFAEGGDCKTLKIVSSDTFIRSYCSALNDALGQLRNIKVLSLEECAAGANFGDPAPKGDHSFTLSNVTTDVAKCVVLPTVQQAVYFTEPSTNKPIYQLYHVKTDDAKTANEFLIATNTTGSLAALAADNVIYNSDGLAAASVVRVVGSFNGGSSTQAFSTTKGNVNVSDVNYINGIVNNNKLDMGNADCDGTAFLADYDNDHFQYVLFPDCGVKATADATNKRFFNSAFINCSSLITAGQYTATDKSFVAHSKNVDKVRVLTELLGETTTKGVLSVSLSGNISARDYSTVSTNMDSKGHLVASCTCTGDNGKFKRDFSKIRVPATSEPYNRTIVYPTSGSSVGGAFNQAQYTSLDLTYAEFIDEDDDKYYPADLSLNKVIYVERYLTDLKLPVATSQYILPDGCLTNSVMTELCIPCNFREIHNKAFQFTSIHHLYTTAESDEQMGVEADGVIDRGDKTMVLSKNVTYIGNQAFVQAVSSEYYFTDVYCLAEKTPVCEFDAFTQRSLVGYGGAEINHSNKRGNYVNVTDGMAMLHYPSTCSVQNQLNYTDITRKYRLYDEVGDLDNSGKLFIWPTQNQYNRSFNQAYAGVTWDAWIPTDDGSDDPVHAYCAGVYYAGQSAQYHSTVYAEANKSVNNGMFANGWSSDWASTGITSADWNDNTWGKAYVYNATTNPSPLTYDWYNYGGWHQFVLYEGYDFHNTPVEEDDNPTYDFKAYNKNQWYSVCFPFNMTKSQVIKAFGTPADADNNVKEVLPFVVTLSGVTRDTKKYHITVNLSDNLMLHKLMYEPNSNIVAYVYGSKYHNCVGYEDYTDDDPIVIEADKPYFIYPQLPASVLNSTSARRCEYTPAPLASTADDHFPIPMCVNVFDQNGKYYLDAEDGQLSSLGSSYGIGNISVVSAINGNETSIFNNLFDNDAKTKWISKVGGYGVIKMPGACKITSYSLSDDSQIDTYKNQGRHWGSWTIYGSNSKDGDWTVVDSRYGGTYDGKEQTFYVNSSHNYQYYKISVDNTTSGWQQLADLNIHFASTAAYRYFFVGNYMEMTMPESSYYIDDEGYLNHKNKGVSSAAVWSPNTAIVMGQNNLDGSLVKADAKTYSLWYWDANPADDFTFFKGTSHAKMGGFGMTWDSVDGESSTQILVPNADNTLTSFSEKAKVYNMSGQAVGSYSENLPKGVYIVEGKKIVIK